MAIISNGFDNPLDVISRPYAGEYYGDSPGYSIANHTVPNNKVLIPEGSDIIMGDFTMTAAEFKVCMRMLREMAKEEYPEEFI